MEEWESLSVDEKSRALKVLIKNLEYSKYNTELEMGAENSLPEPNENILYEYQATLDKIEIKQVYYKSQLAELEGSA